MKYFFSKKRERHILEALAADLPDALTYAKSVGLPLTREDLFGFPGNDSYPSVVRFIQLGKDLESSPLYPEFIKSFEMDDTITRALRRKFFDSVSKFLEKMNIELESSDWGWPISPCTPWMAMPDYEASRYVRRLAMIQGSIANDALQNGDFVRGIVNYERCYLLLPKASPGYNWLDFILDNTVRDILLRLISRSISNLKSSGECDQLFELVEASPPSVWHDFLKGETANATTVFLNSQPFSKSAKHFITDYSIFTPLDTFFIKRRVAFYDPELLQQAALSGSIRFWSFAFAPGYSELSSAGKYAAFLEQIESRNKIVRNVLRGLFVYKPSRLDDVVAAGDSFLLRHAAVRLGLLLKKEYLLNGKFPISLEHFTKDISGLDAYLRSKALLYTQNDRSVSLEWINATFSPKKVTLTPQAIVIGVK